MHTIPTRLLSVAMLLGVSLAVLTACGSSEKGSTEKAKAASSTTTFPMSFTRCGRKVTIDKPPRVLVKDSEGVALSAEAGGNMGGRVIAVANDTQEPLGPGAATLDSAKHMDPFKDPSREAIIGLRPTFSVAHYFAQGQDQLEAAGIDTMIVNVCCEDYAKAHGDHIGFDAIYDDVVLLGKLLGTESYAAKTVARMKQTVAAVQQEAPELRKHLPNSTAAFAFLYQGGFYTYGGPSISNTQIETLGLTNAFGNLKKRGTQLSGEEFIAKDPGVVVIGYANTAGGPEKSRAETMRELRQIPGINRLTAFREHRIILVEGTYVLSLAVEGTRKVADQIRAFA